MLDNGKIVEMGTYDSLIEKNGHFAHFVENYVTSSNKDEEPDIEEKEKGKEAKKFVEFI
jgi:hypothetical protein